MIFYIQLYFHLLIVSFMGLGQRMVVCLYCYLLIHQSYIVRYISFHKCKNQETAIKTMYMSLAWQPPLAISTISLMIY